MITIAIRIIQLLNVLLVVYCLMSFLIPDNSIYLKIRTVVEPIFAPLRRWLYSRFPRLGALPVDLTPMAVWLILQLLVWILSQLAWIF